MGNFLYNSVVAFLFVKRDACHQTLRQAADMRGKEGGDSE